MSSATRPSCSRRRSPAVDPWATRRRMYATVNRVPLITGCPAITLGFDSIRSSSCSLVIPLPCPSNIQLVQGVHELVQFVLGPLWLVRLTPGDADRQPHCLPPILY